MASFKIIKQRKQNTNRRSVNTKRRNDECFQIVYLAKEDETLG